MTRPANRSTTLRPRHAAHFKNRRINTTPGGLDDLEFFHAVAEAEKFHVFRDAKFFHLGLALCISGGRSRSRQPRIRFFLRQNFPHVSIPAALFADATG